MSVIVGRALPDVRDGLKPVHRRILFAMQELGLAPNRAYKKAARIVGEVLGKYHPHGDLAVYESLVRMEQDFSLRYPLVDGQGNFGSIDGDNAAAMRYCVTGDTLVVSDRGLIPIQDLSEKGSEDICLSVLSRDRNIHSAVKWFDSGEHPTLRVTTRGGFSLKGTYNHPLLTWTENEETGRPEFRWKLLSQLGVGDRVVIDRTPDLLWPDSPLSVVSCWPKLGANGDKTRRIQAKILPGELTEDLAFILGALVSEGTVKEREIEFCNSDEEWLAEFDRCWQRTFPDCRLHRFARRPNSYRKKPYQTREIHSQFCIEFLRNLGLSPVRSQDKTLPWSAFRSPRPVAAAFLRAYFEGDGSISSSGKKRVELSCTSTSEKLTHQLQVLFLRFGIASTKRFDRYRGTHKLYIRGLESYRLFQQEIGFFSKRKKEKLASVIASYHKEYSATDSIPFIGSFARSQLNRAIRWKDGREFVLKHNFDRYPNLERRVSSVVATLEPDLQSTTCRLFEHLLETRYLFDPVVRIEESGVARVYSLKVESHCHSFVGNGFINHNTEVRLAPAAEELLSDIEKDTVDFIPNFDESLQEPSLLPSRIPNLLANGASGIAVGMATNIPPHNLKEICEGIQAVIDNPEITAKELMKIVKGPDFPTGGIILGREGIREAYETGRGRMTVRAKAVIESGDHKKDAIIVTEIPYQVNKSNVIESIARLVEDKKIEGIADVRDESDREGMRIVVELKKDSIPQIVLNQLYKHTQLQETFGAIFLALVDGQPKVLNLKQMIEQFVEFRVEVVTRRTRFELDRAEKRAHILEGLKIAIANLDKVIQTIRKAKDPEIAKQELVKNFKLTEVQAKAILEMQLQRLTALEREKIDEEYLELIKKIEYYRSVLKSRTKVLGIVKEESAEVAKKYGDERRTQIVAQEAEIEIEDLIAEEDVLIAISHAGYIKRTPVSLYRRQRRGGTGVTGGGVKEESEDFIEHFFLASTHDSILFFTNKGRVYWRKAYEIPQASRQARGKAIVNLLSLGPEEQVTSFLQVKEFDDKHYVLMATKNGMIKKTRLSEYSNPRSTGIIAIKLRPKDELVSTRLTTGKDEIFLATQSGKAIRFPEKQAREMGRAASGVRGIRFRKKDEVIAMEIAHANAKVLTITTLGFGKKSIFKDYRLQSRGGKGVINIKLTSKNGEVAGVLAVREEDEVILMTTGGMVVRSPVNQIRTSGRAAQGVRLIRLKGKDRVAAAARVAVGEEEPS